MTVGGAVRNPATIPVSELRGIGPARRAALEARGILTVLDLLLFLPSRTKSPPPLLRLDALASLDPGTRVTITGEVQLTRRRPAWRGPGLVDVAIRDGAAGTVLRFFGQPYVAERLRPGDTVVAMGTVRDHKTRFVLPEAYRRVASEEEAEAFVKTPIVEYPSVEGVRPGHVAGLVRRAVAEHAGSLGESLPQETRARLRLGGLAASVAAAHAPASFGALEDARRRLRFDELLSVALASEGSGARDHETATAPDLRPDDALHERILGLFPFRPTRAQSAAIADIRADLGGGRPMARLVEGDVGSGKTAVAAYALLAAALRGRLAALVVPSEPLARQHASVLGRWFSGAGLRIGLVTGTQAPAETRAVRGALAAREVDLVVGTHALLSPSIEMPDLALVVIDEQHRFGVLQRLRALRKGAAPHRLALSATPIPRTLMLTVLGDLEVSVLDERPPGRRPTTTRFLGRDRKSAYGRVRERVLCGDRAFVVLPRIEASEDGVASIGREGRRILAKDLAGIAGAILHGKMDPAAREAALEAFRSGRIQVLVSTSVVELGLDVPEAAVLVVEDAGLFGLSQLHQLRGRVGRGPAAAECLLLGEPRTPEAAERIAILCRTADGFAIAEEDLRLRGPGQILGIRQHGAPELTREEVVEDKALFVAAFAEARRLVSAGLLEPAARAYYARLLGAETARPGAEALLGAG